MTNTSTLPAGAERKGALSARPSRISRGPPRWRIHFHTESATMNREKILILDLPLTRPIRIPLHTAPESSSPARPPGSQRIRADIAAPPCEHPMREDDRGTHR